MTLVVGNLDCELEWAGAPPLPRHVAGKIAAAATLLRALVADGDEAIVWAPGPVDASRVPDVTGSPRWRLVTGPVPTADRVQPWGATARVPAQPARSVDDAAPWRAQLSALPSPTVDAARAGSDRRLAHALAARLGAALPGACTITSVDALVAHLAAGGADASPTDSWVVKATLTAAGRDRVRRRGRDLDAATALRVQRLLDRGGALVFEPWLDRVLDLGQPGLVVAADRWRLLPPHQLHSDATGGFAGIAIHRDDTWLPAEHRARMTATADAVAAELAALGYRGAFTVDAFVHRDRHGIERLHPLAEINPRLTFGLVARAWSERVGAPLTMRLAESAPPAGAITLIAPAPDEPTAAWLET